MGRSILAILISDVVKQGDEVIFDVKCSQALEDMIINMVVNLMWNTGHSLIKNKMAENNCKIGGEMSGHIFFADDYYGYDDAIYVQEDCCNYYQKQIKNFQN